MDTIAFPLVTDTELALPLFVDIIGHWGNQETIDRMNGFPHYQWLQVASGEGELIIGEKSYSVKNGQGFCLFPGVPHRYYATREPWDVHFVSFGGSLCETLFEQAGITESGVYSTADGEVLISHMRSIYAMSQSDRPFLGLECSKLLYAMLLDLMKVVRVSSHSAHQSLSRLHPVIQYIEAHAGSLITIEDLAGAIHVTPQYLCLLFKKAMRMRPMEYVNRERISRSKQLMFRESTLKMQEIAKLSGFDSASYFSSVFKRLEGVGPEQFKKMHGMR
ncbi:AraC family transcriptional regulator [Paenibacillus sp. FSL H8-0537]|uniref:AraC family transcriptional regulator n=1 Tax=Paenibacillus sp. FSL H8-0537 TaxID=2921399 RepID=UPI0031013D64